MEMLSLQQRLILRNQFKILAHLDSKEHDHWEHLSAIVQHGFEGEYPALTDWFSTPLSAEECAFVSEVLQMHRMFEYARDAGVDMGTDQNQFNYCGFDGNEEPYHASYAEFLIDQPNRWEELKTKESNSHRNMIPTYRRMLAAWEQSENKFKLTTLDFQRIAEAI